MAARITRALISTYEKEGLVPLARGLQELGVEIVSTGGTARLLDENGVRVLRVSEVTGFPEMMDGRVKTLHPLIHAGILAVRSDARHMEELRRAGVAPIDLVVVNLYPFEKTSAKEGVAIDEVLEMIDIGGPSMVRAAAKNHPDVGVVVDPADYPAVLQEIRNHGALETGTRLRLAAKAFRHTADYDTAVASYLARLASDEPRSVEPAMPRRLRIDLEKSLDLVYGENPHQKGAFYIDPGTGPPSVARAAQIQGKPLSFNNILDFDGALAVAAGFAIPCCAIIKHGNPCGVATSTAPADAFRKALACDPLSAFGGVIAFNRSVDGETAKAVAEAFYEGVLAPAFDAEALETFSRKKNLRLLRVGEISGYARSGFDLRRIHGGMLAQEWDGLWEPVRDASVVTRRSPSEEEWKALEFAWTVVRHVKSNAIVYAFSDRTVGIGAGQMSRVDSARLGIDKAQVPLRGAVMASDAFFPFRDGVDVAAEAGVSAVIQPGGSIRDSEVISAADEHGMAMVVTGRRHFRH
jgi:phosphoribosylaminoimidazolecarboxamide formyltransferase/IMP cyclohydrolase